MKFISSRKGIWRKGITVNRQHPMWIWSANQRGKIHGNECLTVWSFETPGWGQCILLCPLPHGHVTTLPLLHNLKIGREKALRISFFNCIEWKQFKLPQLGCSYTYLIRPMYLIYTSMHVGAGESGKRFSKLSNIYKWIQYLIYLWQH